MAEVIAITETCSHWK